MSTWRSNQLSYAPLQSPPLYRQTGEFLRGWQRGIANFLQISTPIAGSIRFDLSEVVPSVYFTLVVAPPENDSRAGATFGGSGVEHQNASQGPC